MVPCLKRMNSVVFSFTQNLLLPSLGYAVAIWIGQVYLQEALDHRSSLRLFQFLLDIGCFLLLCVR